MAPPGQSSNNPLPSKELALFKKIIKCYETKQYKIGLRCARNILIIPQYSEHGETLAMKGLILNCTGKHQEAMDCVKRGLKADIRSHVCWHVYGLVHRAEKKYDEAIRAYKHALRLDTDNLQILRDLSLLQIQMRDLEGFKKSRYDLLRLRPQQKVSWVGYATAYHLLKDYDKALSIIEDFLANNEPQGAFDQERSEMVLYQNMVLRESGQKELALKKLEENSTHILDKLTYQETRAELLYELGRAADSERLYRMLIDRNPECHKYYEMLLRTRGLITPLPGHGPEAIALFDELASQYPRASTPRRFALLIAEGDDLRRRLHRWLVDGLRKGIPSLFKSVTPLYKSQEKVAILESVLLEYVKRIEERGYINGCLEDDPGHFESPTTAVWLYALVAQHYDRLRSTATAMKYIERALQHTPTLIELLMIKAKIHKHAGDEQMAARVIDEAQSLDTADRYINSKAAKYLLRAGRIEDAESMCAKFTRENVKAAVSLMDMQCMWFETEMARAHRKKGDYGEALKMCHQVEQHFVGIYEDQFDFHTYCIRKMTLCAYVKLLRLEEKMREHDFYYTAAEMAIKIYLRIIDRPGDIWPEETDKGDNMSASEMKKAKRKANKEKAQKEKEKEDKEKAKKEPPKDLSVDAVPVVAAEGSTLLKCASPLEEAAKFASPILQLGCSRISSLVLAFDVYHRKHKPLLMLQALHAADNIDPHHPLLHVPRIKFLIYYKAASLSGVVGEIAQEVVNRIFHPTTDAVTLNEQYRSRFNDSFPHRVAVAEASILLDPSSASSIKASIMRSLNDKINERTLPALMELKDIVDYGRMGEWTKQEVDSLTKACLSLYREAAAFGGGVSLSAPSHIEGDNAEHHSFE